MKRVLKLTLGITLLEIMLVLAVAAMIIVMSVRYYQSAVASQQATATVEQIVAITAAGDALYQGSGSYTSVTTSNVKPFMPSATGLSTQWAGGTITVAGAADHYAVTIPLMPANVCALVKAQLMSNKHYKIDTTCSTDNQTFSYSYYSLEQ